MNEDFVSFDLAKKLKEKGFKELCLAYYTNNDTLYYNYSHKAGACYKDCYLSHNLMPKDSVSGKFVDAPTISQVLKWLREEKKLHIIIATFIDQLNRCYTWGCEIWNISEFPKHIREASVMTNFTDYNSAALAGIEYVIDNLIRES